MSDLTTEMLVQIKTLFDRFDADDNDTLEWDEFCKLIDELNIEISLENRTKIFHIIDSNNTGKISFDEFAEIWKKN